MYYLFYLPIGTDVACRRRPIATLVLLAINVLAYFASRYFLPFPALIYALALKPAAPTLLTAVTACFLHASLFHLVMNMLYLALLGAPVEDRLGPWRFLGVYLLAGVLGMGAQAAFVTRWAPAVAPNPVVGASGAVAGILGALLVRLPYARVRVASATLLLLHGVHRVGVRYLPAWIAVAAWLALQLAYGLAAPAGRTAYASHLGGLAAGVALALGAGAARAGRFEWRLRRGERYMERGAWFAAAGEFESALRLAPRDPGALAAHARALVAAGRRSAAIRAFRAAIAAELGRGAAPAAARLYLELERLLPAAVLEPADQIRVALALRREGELAAAAQSLLDLAAAYSEHPQAELARLLAAEIRGALAGDLEAAAGLVRDLDLRRLSPRWRAHAIARRAGAGARGARCSPGR